MGVPGRTIFISDVDFEILKLLELLKRLLGILDPATKHANLDLFHVVAHVRVTPQFV